MRASRTAVLVLALVAAVVAVVPSAGADTVDPDHDVYSFGDAIFYGSTGPVALNKPIVGMAAMPNGAGYWEVASDGGIFAFGQADFLGSTGNLALRRPIVGMAGTQTDGGYWLVASDGGIFAFGDAKFLGSLGGRPLVQPIVGMARTPAGGGYWLVSADGGIFTFGNARFRGSSASFPLYQPVVGMAASPTGSGYWIVARGTCQFAGRTPREIVYATGGEVMLLTNVEATEHQCWERATFDFTPEDRNPGKLSYEIRYRPGPFRDTAGRVVPVAGSAFLEVRVEPARTVDLSGDTAVVTYNGPKSIKPAGHEAIKEIRLVDDFEANMVWVIGLDRQRNFAAVEFNEDDQLVVDIQD